MSDYTLEQLQNMEFVIDFPNGDVFTSTLSVADSILHSYLASTIILGIGIGVIVILSVLLAMVARTYKSIMFCLYQLNFALGIIVYSVTIHAYIERYHNITATYFQYPAPESEIQLALFGSFMSLFFTMSLLASLCFQVYTAYKNTESRYIKIAVYALISLCYFQTVFIWLWTVVLAVIAANNPGEMSYSWANNAIWPSFGASSMVCSLLLTARLYVIVRSRAKLGLEKFDAIKVIFIVAIQNATIPSLFAFIYGICSTNTSIPEALGGLCTILCCVFFPIGYIWAQARSQGPGSRDGGCNITAPCDDTNADVSPNTAYWNGGIPSPTCGNSAEYGVDKEGNHYKTQAIA